ncbi:type II secretion system protein GspL [Endozoicomonas ascidiicola]|uniref:type II secretion system protein GspL n=1 Tax=Endozoicomonas ascidiicola TaxID=1698521 RepID=UPI00082BE921|nr:type II secretion system protein GspL [Endozoicomonas ascidiicola]
MSAQLLIRLPEDISQPVYWLVYYQEPLKEDNNNQQRVASGSWLCVNDFISHFADVVTTNGLLSSMNTVILVPSARVTLHSLDVQGRLTPAVRKSLKWRLEEEFSEDVDNLHVALLDHVDHQAHLAAISKSDMNLWQKWITAAGVVSEQWLPDGLTLPFIEGQCSLFELDDVIISRHGQWQAAACDSKWLELFLDGLKQKKEGLKVNHLPPNPTSPLFPLAPQANSSSFNLLQGDWQPASHWKLSFRPWLSTTLAACVLLALMTTNSLMNTFQLEQQAEFNQQQAKDVYSRLFPGERIVKLTSQMQQKLDALQQPENSSDTMLTMLAQITPLLMTFPDVKANSMSFSISPDGKQQSIRIQASARDFQRFNQLRDTFEQSVNGDELTMAIEALERTGNEVTGIVVISGELS